MSIILKNFIKFSFQLRFIVYIINPKYEKYLKKEFNYPFLVKLIKKPIAPNFLLLNFIGRRE